MNKFLWIPLAFGLMFFPSISYRVALDGAGSTYYGFPLPWNSRGLASSLTKDIYIIPLCIDVMFYLAIGLIALHFFKPMLLKLNRKYRTVIVGLIWAYGMLGMAAMVVFSNGINEAYYSFWYPSGFKILSFSIGPNV